MNLNICYLVLLRNRPTYNLVASNWISDMMGVSEAKFSENFKNIFFNFFRKLQHLQFNAPI